MSTHTAPATDATTGEPATGSPFIPLSQHTIGPFFPATFFRPIDNDLTRMSAEMPSTAIGERVLVHGTLTKLEGLAVVNGIIELWQADSHGRFRHPEDPDHREADPDFIGWGRAWTDAEGRFSFLTVLPGGYRQGNEYRAPHANLMIMGAGLMRPVHTTMFFPDFEEDNLDDPVLNAIPAELRERLVASADAKQDGMRAFRFDICLRGSRDQETPFFEV